MARFPKGSKGGDGKPIGNIEGNMRPRITDYWDSEDIKDYFSYLKKNYKKSDTLAKFVGEQLMGKAVQPIANDGDRPLIVKFDNALTRSTAKDR